MLCNGGLHLIDLLCSGNVAWGSEECLNTMCDLELVLEQPFLTPHATPVTGKRTIAANNAMTGNDNSELVFAVGAGCCADYFRVAESFGKIHITDGAAIGDFDQFTPYSFLELGAFLVYRNGEYAAAAMKKFDELFGALVHYFGNAGFAMRKLVGIIEKSEFADELFRTAYFQQADRTFIIGIMQFIHGNFFGAG